MKQKQLQTYYDYLSPHLGIRPDGELLMKRDISEIIDRTNNILKDIKLKRNIKVYQNRFSKATKIVKRGYSTLISTLGYTYMNFISTPFRGRFLPTEGKLMKKKKK